MKTIDVSFWQKVHYEGTVDVEDDDYEVLMALQTDEVTERRNPEAYNILQGLSTYNLTEVEVSEECESVQIRDAEKVED
jgi:hypothetical protein